MDETKVMERLARSEQDLKAVNRRLNKLEELTESIHAIAVQVKDMREDLNSTVMRVVEIEKRPQRRYEAVVTTVITTAIGVAAGYFLKGGF